MSQLPGTLRIAFRPVLRLPIACRNVRFNSTPSYQPPASPPPADNPHRAFYKSWGVPVTKVFLGALFTYQLLYWSWLKLESLETKRENEGEISKIEAQLKTLTKDKAGKS